MLSPSTAPKPGGGSFSLCPSLLSPSLPPSDPPSLNRRQLARRGLLTSHAWLLGRSLWAGVGNKMVTSMLHAAVMFSVVEVFRALNRVLARKLLKFK